MIWVKDAPEFGVNGNDDVCAFIDQYVSCKLPAEDGKLKDLVYTPPAKAQTLLILQEEKKPVVSVSLSLPVPKL